IGFARGSLLIVLNCSESQWDGRDYEVQTEWREKRFRQIFNSQAEEFGGWEGSWTASSSSSGEGVKGHHEELLYSSAHARLAVKLPKWSVTVFEMIEG
ncbi:alpha catalytic domain-containing protein, partial [Cystoisospora suis]